MTATGVSDSTYSEAVRDLAQGRESASTRKVRLEARAAILRGSDSDTVKRNLIRNGIPDTLAAGIVAQELAKRSPISIMPSDPATMTRAGFGWAPVCRSCISRVECTPSLSKVPDSKCYFSLSCWAWLSVR